MNKRKQANNDNGFGFCHLPASNLGGKSDAWGKTLRGKNPVFSLLSLAKGQSLVPLGYLKKSLYAPEEGHYLV